VYAGEYILKVQPEGMLLAPEFVKKIFSEVVYSEALRTRGEAIAGKEGDGWEQRDVRSALATRWVHSGAAVWYVYVWKRGSAKTGEDQSSKEAHVVQQAGKSLGLWRKWRGSSS
jgi:hypothetical protein